VAHAHALAAPERVTRLVLYDAWVYEAQLPTFFHMARSDGVGEALFAAFYDQRPEDRMALAFHDPTIIEQDFVDHAVEMLARPGTRAAALAAVRAMRYGEIEAQYGTIDKPVLLLWGEDDLVTPVAYGNRLHTELPNARLETFADCGHFPMIEAFHPSTRALVAFLDSAPTRESTAAPETQSAPEAPSEPPTRSPSELELESDSETPSTSASDSETPSQPEAEPTSRETAP
jgi:pimeloyl-ACP methyl ester carboxylesterase